MDLDTKFTQENRSVLFFVDNCSAHPKGLARKLKSIKLIFFPPNMTSKVQPMDAGIIKDVKVKYRRKLVNKLIKQLDSDSESIIIDINVLDAISYVSQAWNEVEPKTIKNCFKHVQIADQWNDEDNLPLSRLKNLIGQQERLDDVDDVEIISNSININENWNRLHQTLKLDCLLTITLM